MKYYHLGGGLGFKEDKLFNWKAGFSDLFLEYKSWRYVANEQIYNSLVNLIGIDPHNNIDYFPLCGFGVMPLNNVALYFKKYPNLFYD